MLLAGLYADSRQALSLLGRCRWQALAIYVALRAAAPRYLHIHRLATSGNPGGTCTYVQVVAACLTSAPPAHPA
jgi:hypothetical protein